MGSRSRRLQDAQQVVEDAWDHLVEAVDSAGDTGRSVGRRASAAADEARRRASAAADALAGRRPSMPWEWIAGAAAVGLALGWIASEAVKRMVLESDPPRSLTPEPARSFEPTPTDQVG
jgi:ElaB/YqjD/DUF883 family membrane-anchored ribosome-binding protein